MRRFFQEPQTDPRVSAMWVWIAFWLGISIGAVFS
jgi:hypothetical protein